MRKWHCFRWLVVIFGLLVSQWAEAQEEESLSGKIVVVKLRSDDLQESRRIREWEKLLDKAEKEDARAIVFDVNVKVNIAWDIQETILERLGKITIPTITYVNSSATGAGVLFAIGSDEIYLSNTGIIGSAGIEVEDGDDEAEKKRLLSRQLSLFKARARNLAKLKGHRPELVEAFIDGEVEIIYGDDVVSKRGEILTLTSSEAINVMSDGKALLAAGVASSLDDVLKKEKLRNKVVNLSPRELAQERSRSQLKTAPMPVKVEEPKEDKRLFGKKSGDSYEGKVVILKVGTNDLSSGKARFTFMDRILKKAQLDGASGVIFDLDTPGGIAWFTQGLILNSLQDISIPTCAFVNTRAQSAGAIIAIGTDSIYMKPAASIGAALVVSPFGELPTSMKSKQTQMIISVVRNMAELKGHNPDIAEAFVSTEKEVNIGDTNIHKKGEVLNLNTIRATEVIEGKPVLAKGVANSLEELIRKENLSGEIVVAEELAMESFAAWVRRFSALLIIIGIAGVYLEMKTPGFALPGVIGLSAFGLYFFGNHVAGNLAGYELAVLFVIGLILIGVEIFLFPGLLVPALVGGLMVIASLWLAMVDRVDLEWKWGNQPDSGGFTGDPLTWFDLLKGGFNTMGIGIIGGTGLILLALKFLPKTKVGGLLIHQGEVPSGASIDSQTAESSDDNDSEVSYVGWQGESLTDLRPAGKGRFKGKQLDIISEGEFIPKSSTIIISKHEGSRIVVKRV